VDSELKDYLAAMETRIDARLEKVETTPPSEFHKCAAPAELRS
jgi:hypothetical protein